MKHTHVDKALERGDKLLEELFRQKHSPGPWDIHDTASLETSIYAANKVCTLAKPSGFYRSPAETEANARLIAAAPELLEALREVSVYLGMLLTETQDIKKNQMLLNAAAAISKAEGKDDAKGGGK